MYERFHKKWVKVTSNSRCIIKQPGTIETVDGSLSGNKISISRDIGTKMAFLEFQKQTRLMLTIKRFKQKSLLKDGKKKHIST